MIKKGLETIGERMNNYIKYEKEARSDVGLELLNEYKRDIMDDFYINEDKFKDILSDHKRSLSRKVY